MLTSSDKPISFKYSVFQCKSNNDERLDSNSDNCCSSIGDSSHPQDHRSEDDTKGEEKARFFKHYEMHSKQLVNALKEWGQQLKFTSCEYEYGRLNVDYSDQVEPTGISYMELMKEHIKNEERYQMILPSVLDIENKHREICKQIERIMSYPTSMAPLQPSFEKIIIDKIALLCPTLKRSRDVELRENNIYLDTYIFRLIFNTVSMNVCTIPLTVQSTHNTNIWQLAYQNGIIILAQGEKASMYTLKEAIDQLIVDKNIKERVKDYYEYHKQLTNDVQIETLKNTIQKLYDYTHGGKPLGGYPACELCGPFDVN